MSVVLREPTTPSTKSGVPLFVRSTTPMGVVAIAMEVGDLSHALVRSDDGRLCGVVSREAVLSHTATADPVARSRWEEMPVESVMTRFECDATYGRAAPAHPDAPAEAFPIWEDGQLVALGTEGDLLLSWSLVEPMLRRARLDAVTNLPNRSSFDTRLREEWNRAARTRSPLAVLLIDLDDFKRVNDQHGHAAGDDVLRNVAECLRSALRSYDVVCRFGGDEFAAVCYGCEPDELSLPASRVLESIAELRAPCGGALRVSVGAGIAATVPERAAPYELLEAADRALYRAKDAGKGCVRYESLDDADLGAVPVGRARTDVTCPLS